MGRSPCKYCDRISGAVDVDNIVEVIFQYSKRLYHASGKMHDLLKEGELLALD